MLDGFDAQSIGFLVPYISERLNIPLRAFGPVLAAGLLGLMLVAMATGPIADRWGRKGTVIVSTLTFATFAIATARATSFSQLVVFRFLTGLGLGGALPNVIALASEYTPRRMLRTFVSMLSGGMAVGALVAGVSSSVMIPHWGWQSVLYLGGVIPIGLVLILIKGLPESVRFLTIRTKDARQISKIMGCISDEAADTPIAPPIISKAQADGIPVKHLFTEGRARVTVLLWILFFMSLLTLYFIISWLPALLRQSGMASSAGVTAISLFSVAGFTGAVLEGTLINRGNAQRILLVQLLLSAGLIASLAFSTASYASIMAITFALGCCVQGVQAGLNAIAAGFYPTTIRSTGVGWALAVGRIGSIVGPLLAGVLLTRLWTPQQIFLAGAVPAACAALAVVVTGPGRQTARNYLTFEDKNGHGRLD